MNIKSVAGRKPCNRNVVKSGSNAINLPEYDALANLTDKLSKNMKKAEENLKSFLSIAKKVALILGTIWGISKLVKFANKLDNLVDLFKNGNKATSLFANTLKNFTIIDELFAI